MSSMRTCRWALPVLPVLAALLPLAGTLQANDRVKVSGARPTPAPPRPPQVIDVDPAGSMAVAWATFLAEARLDPTIEAYDVLPDVAYGPDGVEPSACAAHRDALAAAVHAVPVSIALRHAEMQCAEAEGDDARAERALVALAALSKHALGEYGDGAMRRPIRVVQPWDVYALLNSLGYPFLYEYHLQTRHARYFPLTVAAWDPQREIERHLAFDYIDATTLIDRDSPDAGWPTLRDQNVLAYARGQARHSEPAALDVLAIQAWREAENKAEGLTALREAAAQGGLQSLTVWVLSCTATDAPKGCADGLIDALLPLAESRHALPLALLSHAYRHGVGVKADAATADGLWTAANARWQRSGAAPYLVLHMLQHGMSEQAAAYLPQLRESAGAGNADARYLLLMFRQSESNPRFDDGDIAFLRDSANNGQGAGEALLGLYHAGRGEFASAYAAYDRAASQGNARSQYMRGMSAWKGQAGKARDPGEAERLLRLAAAGGEMDAMAAMARIEGMRGAWGDAERWLLPAVELGDGEAALALADLYAEGGRGVSGGAEDALRIYGILDEHYDMAKARRRLAGMAMTGRGMPADPGKARRLLERDAKAGDTASQSLLGMALLTGELGRPDVEQGRGWMERAVAGGDREGGGLYGTWLVERPAPVERSRGLALMESAVSAGDLSTRNNLAWARCVSPHADVRDGGKGLAVARPLEDDPNATPGQLDTVAACHAATGDFERAVALQQRAIDTLRRNTPGATPSEGMTRRLALYREKRAYTDKE